MDEYIPGQVYDNLVKLMKYRGAKMNETPLTREEVSRKLNHYEFIILLGNRAAIDADGKPDPRGAGTVVVILIAPDSKYANKSPDFKKLLKNLPKVQQNEILEVLFVSEIELTMHIKKQLIAYRAANPKIYIEHSEYEIFLIEIPIHKAVPRHEIANEAEVAEFCNLHHTHPSLFPKILQSDPVAVWLGIKPGMIVTIHRISETAGRALIYRMCIKG